MHVPDGFLDVPTSIATGAAAAAAVGISLRKARDELDERTAPLAGLTAAFVFAAQMLNFPVGIGTSGHLVGGALAAVLVGPWTGMLCLSVVLIVQGLLFADGGLTALGTNITLMGVVTVVVGWAVTRGVLAILPRRPSSVTPAAAIGALLSVPAAAGLFVVLFAIGGQAGLPLGGFMVSMLGWHTLIGIGEAVITALTVSAVIVVRPDLAYAARGLEPTLRLRQADGSLITVERPNQSGRRGTRGILVAGGLAALVLAGGVSFFASGDPDGLEYVAAEEGFVQTARDHLLGDSVLADYGDLGGIPVGVAGVLGVVATVGAGLAVFRAVSRSRRSGSRMAGR